ncbi:MAG: hypothetical protein ACTSQI_10435 [Candidatus Helarchaeota archaeon]
MPENEKSECPDDHDPMKELLRQMGLCEDEIGAALDLAENIEQKVAVKPETKTDISSADIKILSEKELMELVEKQKTQLDHFQNVVAIQLILIIKKYKDKVIRLEEKLRQKNAKIQELSQQLEFLR